MDLGKLAEAAIKYRLSQTPSDVDIDLRYEELMKYVEEIGPFLGPDIYSQQTDGGPIKLYGGESSREAKNG